MCYLSPLSVSIFHAILITVVKCLYIYMQENPHRANGHIFNVGNPYNEVTVKQLAEMMTKVRDYLRTKYFFSLINWWIQGCS